jgi:hypothetical protein
MTGRFLFSRGFRLPLLALAAVMAFSWCGGAFAQFNAAYDTGYKPMLESADKLKGLIDSAEKREDYGAVKDLGAAYLDKLDRVIAGLENAGKKYKDSSNASFESSSNSASLAAARDARKKAEQLRDRGDNKQNCKAEAIDLRARLDDLDKEMNKCWKDHEDYFTKVREAYFTSRQNWQDSVKDEFNSLDDLSKTYYDALAKLKDKQSRAEKAGDAIKDAENQVKKANEDLVGAALTKTPDEIKTIEENRLKAANLVSEINDIWAKANAEADEAEKAYDTAWAALKRANEDFKKKTTEDDDRYKVVFGLFQKQWEFAQEYKPFSW